VSVASVACGLAQLEGRRSQACRCSRAHRPSGSDSEPRERLGVPAQRHPSEVGDPLTRTPLRRACRPQRPSSPLIAHAHRHQPCRTQGTTARRPAWSRARGRCALASPPVACGQSSDRAGDVQLIFPVFAVGLLDLLGWAALLDRAALPREAPAARSLAALFGRAFGAGPIVALDERLLDLLEVLDDLPATAGQVPPRGSERLADIPCASQSFRFGGSSSSC
jgi:hypothetical protein